MSRGLFHRLGSGARQIDEVSSILAHLQDLLNSRLGQAACLNDFGVMDFSDVVHTLPDGLTQLCLSIRKTIERYEPRLASVRIHPVEGDDPLLLHFEIVAKQAAPPRRTLRMRTRMGTGGRFTVAQGI